MKYPIIILTRDRPVQFREMMESIESRTDPDTYRIIVCDNDSTQPEMVDYLKDIEERHVVIRNKENNGFEGFNPGLKISHEKYFLLSDPDIVLPESMPAHWVLRFVEIMDVAMVPKAGVALNINLDKNEEFQKLIMDREKEYWGQIGEYEIPGIKATCFIAPVDTTLAIYRRDTYKFWTDTFPHFNYGDGICPDKIIHQNQYNEKYYIPPIRIAGEYTCRHTGWEMHTKYQSDYEYYKMRCDMDIASTTAWMTGKKP